MPPPARAARPRRSSRRDAAPALRSDAPRPEAGDLPVRGGGDRRGSDLLCGVLVGRGVPIADVLNGWSQFAAFAVADEVTDKPPAGISTPRREPSASALADANLSYYRRLDGSPAHDRVMAPVAAPPDREPPPAASVRPTPAPPPPGGYTVQVLALRERGAAEQLAAHLTARGYPALSRIPPPARRSGCTRCV